MTKPREDDADPLVDLAIRLIDELNAKYASPQNGSFLLLHRHRIFNRRQGVWMGWERKRGKLLDLNKLLAGELRRVSHQGRPPSKQLRDIRYVLTLDSDTQLPRGTAGRLVGAIAHPLNQAVIDPRLRIRHFGLRHPAAADRRHRSIRASRRAWPPSIPVKVASTFIRAPCPMPTRISLAKASSPAKASMKSRSFHAVLNRRFPRNALLSHDLIEGAYARAGLATDVELIDDYPSHLQRIQPPQHRWVRGDWQIAHGCFPASPTNRAAGCQSHLRYFALEDL